MDSSSSSPVRDDAAAGGAVKALALRAAADGIIVCISPGSASYIGTRAQIEAEVAIPASLQWPQRFDRVSWSSGEQSFSLMRSRPRGWVGSRKSCEALDYWRLYISHGRGKSWRELEIQRRVAELGRLVWLSSPAGMRWENECWEKIAAPGGVSRHSETWRAFMARCLSTPFGGSYGGTKHSRPGEPRQA